MSSAITVAGQTRINQLRGDENPLVIDRMVLALVPDLDPTQPVDRNQQMPDPAHVVHTYDIPPEFKGYVDPDQVVYSMVLGSDVGDFSFNWIGTVDAGMDTVISVTTTPETPKRKTDPSTNTTGNNITRNVMMQFQDAQALTGVSISAETWQFDYTTWMIARIEAHDQEGEAHPKIRDELVPVGVPFPWPTNTPPEGWVIMQGQAFDTVAYPHLALAYPAGLLPDMRGQTVKGTPDNRAALSVEADGVKSHSHTGSAVSTNLGTKTTNTAGSHNHTLRWSRGTQGGSLNYFERGEYYSSYNASSNYPIVAGGAHPHTVAIGSHSHSVTINAAGSTENTVKNIAFNWIVRLA